MGRKLPAAPAGGGVWGSPRRRTVVRTVVLLPLQDEASECVLVNSPPARGRARPGCRGRRAGSVLFSRSQQAPPPQLPAPIHHVIVGIGRPQQHGKPTRRQAGRPALTLPAVETAHVAGVIERRLRAPTLEVPVPVRSCHQERNRSSISESRRVATQTDRDRVARTDNMTAFTSSAAVAVPTVAVRSVRTRSARAGALLSSRASVAARPAALTAAGVPRVSASRVSHSC